MINTVLLVFAVLLCFSVAYPWARWLLTTPYRQQTQRPDDPMLTVCLTIALSVGLVTVIMLVWAAVLQSPLSFWLVTIPALLLHALGWWVWLRAARHLPPVDTVGRTWWRRPLPLLAMGLIALIMLGVLFDAAYWPFRDVDTLSIYAPIALRFVYSGQFIAAPTYGSYPVLVPLTFSYLHLANGTANEYMSRFVIAALSLVSVGGAYLLGRDLFNRRVGITAAFLFITSPIILRWSTAAYTDLPAAAYYVLAAFFAWRLYTSPHPIYALLTGLLASLAAFSKNGALLLAGSLVGWVIYSYWARWRNPPSSGEAISKQHILLMLIGYLPLVALWYGHAWLAYGWVIPPTGWTDKAIRTLPNLLTPMRQVGNFSIAGVLSVIAWPLLLAQLWRTRWHFDARVVLLFGFTIPFWLVWWWLFSYDPRFLVMIWALMSVAAGWLAVSAHDLLPARAKPALNFVLPLLLVAIAAPALFQAVEHKNELLKTPLISEEDRLRLYVHEGFDVVFWLEENTSPDDGVLVTEYWQPYYVAKTHPNTLFCYSPRVCADMLSDYAYWVVRSNVDVSPWLESGAIEPVFSAGGRTIYRLVDVSALPEVDG